MLKSPALKRSLQKQKQRSMDERIAHLSLPVFALKIVVDALNRHAMATDVSVKDTGIAAQVAREFAAVIDSPFESKGQEDWAGTPELKGLPNAVKH